LVDGAASIAKKFAISPLVIGLTIVAFGTSAPELIVSLSSTLNGNGQIAVANVLGSNILNILLILGLCACIRPVIVKSSTVWKEIPLVIAAAISVLFLGFADTFKGFNIQTFSSLNFDEITGYLSVAQGIVLLTFFVIYIYYNLGIAKKNYTEENQSESSQNLTTTKSIFYVVLGLGTLILAGQVAVTSAVEIAKTFAISDRIIGLTIVSIGTSLPELVTSVKATIKGQQDIAIGNIVGSSIFNVFLVLGLSSLFGVLKLSSGELIDSIIAIVAALILFVSIFVIKRSQIGKAEGVFMVCTYFVYVSYLIVGK